MHDDLAALHARRAAAVAAAGHVSGITPDGDPAALHLRPEPVSGVAFDHDLAAAHDRPGMQPDIPRDSYPAAGHGCADMLDRGQIAVNLDMAVKMAPAIEKIAQFNLTVAMQDGEPGNGRVIQRLEPVRANTVRFQRRLRPGMQFEFQGHVVGFLVWLMTGILFCLAWHK